jgi:DNA-binding transcriptional LysR family regulator
MLLSEGAISISIWGVAMDELERVERRVKLHDVRVLLSVAEMGSMSKAAERLGTSQPAVSRAISDLEHALGVTLFDRSPAGVEPTAYGRALIKRGLAVFDELRQGIKDIEFIADPTAGVLRIGCSDTLADLFVPTAIDELTRKYPRLSFHVDTDTIPSIFDRLATRSVELVISRVPKNAAEKYLVVEELIQDSLVVAAGPRNRWMRRSSIELAELLDEPWTLPPIDSFGSTFIAEAFRARGLDPPHAVATAVSRSMRNRLLATGRFLTMVPGFSVVPDQYPFLRILPVKLPDTRAPVSVVTVKNRALSPLALLFLDTFRSVVTKSLAKRK